jgi:hypothetical protein
LVTIRSRRHQQAQDSHRIPPPPANGDYLPAPFREDLNKLIVELQKLA